MASLTIRNLDAKVKQALRVRAAANKHSMEEEARIILAHYSQVSSVNDHVATVVARVNDCSTDNAHGNKINHLSINTTGCSQRDAMSPRPDNTSCQAHDSEPSWVKSILNNKNIVLIIGGGIAAYKALELIRRLSERGASVSVVMTEAAQKFVTALAANALSGHDVYTDLFAHDNIAHIRLARQADLVIVAPATANRLATTALGLGSDMGAALLLATRAPVLLAPAMNPAMWQNKATLHNYQLLKSRNYYFIGPEIGEMAERGEPGEGRMSEPLAIVEEAERILSPGENILAGKHIIVTSGPTQEAIDPVRYLANRSSGKQGHAIAAELARLGANVTLISGPVSINDPSFVTTIHVTTGEQMLAAVQKALPAEAAIFVAAVADWKSPQIARQKLKKRPGQDKFSLTLEKNPDILATIAKAKNRPKFIVGFAAETEDLIRNARQKLKRKGADLIVLNDVTPGVNGESVMGGDRNSVTLIDKDSITEWPQMEKTQLARQFAAYIAAQLKS